MELSKRTVTLTLRIVLTALCALAVGFIIYNALQTAEKSAEQSSTVVEVVQTVVSYVAPESNIVTATGEDYERLHTDVRNMAHFFEYALLGVLAGWCCFSYTKKKKWLLIPAGGVVALAAADEILQTFVAGRGTQFIDVLLDATGGCLGIGFALLTVWLGCMAVEKYQKKREDRS